MTEAELIGLGGALGAGCRYEFGLLVARGVTVHLQAAHKSLEEALQRASSIAAVAAAAIGCLVASALSLGLARCFS
jgi:hypothetical protein